MKRRLFKPRLQSGAAILLAMLIVSVAAVFAARAQWQQWQLLETEAHERLRQQAHWILVGALDWGRLILREDARASNGGGTDHLGEPWAIALQRSKLSDFLHMGGATNDAVKDDAAKNAAASDDLYLAGKMEDAQGRLNLQNLLQAQGLDSAQAAVWRKLFVQLDLPLSELDTALQNLELIQQARVLAAQAAQAGGRNTDPQAQQILSKVKLQPERLEDMVLLGLSPSTLSKLSPYAVWLPERTVVNANTASALVLYASIPALELAAAQHMVQARNLKPFDTLPQIKAATGLPDSATDQLDNTHGVASRYFLVEGQLQLQDLVVQEQSLVKRDGSDVRTVWRRALPLASKPPA